MLIIGMTGPIGHGKSTFAEAMLELDPTIKRLESSMIIAEVANSLHRATTKIPARDDIDSINDWLRPLAGILVEIVGAHCTFDQIKIDAVASAQHPIEYDKLRIHIDSLAHNPTLLNDVITQDNKETYRPLLQWLGGYLPRKVDSKIWYAEIIRRAKRLGESGCSLCIVGGLRFPSDAEAVHQAGGKIIKVYRPGHLQFDILDPTERERDNVPIDSTIVSDGDLAGVKKCAQKVLDDLRKGELQAQYIVSQITATG